MCADVHREEMWSLCGGVDVADDGFGMFRYIISDVRVIVWAREVNARVSCGW